MKKISVFAFSVLFSVGVFAQCPAGYNSNPANNCFRGYGFMQKAITLASSDLNQTSATDSFTIITGLTNTTLLRNADYIKIGIARKDNPAVYVGNGNSVGLSDSAFQVQFDTASFKRGTDSIRVILGNGNGAFVKDSGFVVMTSVGATVGKINAYQIGGYSNNAQITQTSTDTITFRFSGDTAYVSAGVTAWNFTPALPAAAASNISGQTRATLTGPQGTMQNGQLSVTVSASDLTVALKTLAGTDPSTSDTVFIRIGNTLRWVTAALSVTLNDGTNWFNSGTASLATAEIDYFAYLGYNATDGVVIGFSRIIGNQYSDFSTTSTNEKYCAISTITNAAATDYYSVIGRFAATLSAGAAYTWTVPTFTAINLINRPIFETRFLSMIATTATLVGWSVLTTANITYQVRQKSVIYHHNIQGTSDNATTTLPLPISLSTATGASGTYYTFSQDNGTVSGVGGRGVISTAAPTIITLTNSPDGIAYTNVGTKISSCITIQYVTD